MREAGILAILTLTAAHAAHAGPDANPDRFVIQEGTLAISRPDASWTFEADTSEPPVVARIHGPDEIAVADVQVHHLPGAHLEAVTRGIDSSIAADAPDFTRLSGEDVRVNGIPAFELSFTATKEGTLQTAKILVCKPGDTLYIVKCRSPTEDWQRFGPACDALLSSFEILESAISESWGRRIEWDAVAGPQAREHASLILDPGRDRAVMLLGSGYEPYLDPLGDAWAFDLGRHRWSSLELTGDPIPPGGSRRAARVEGGAFVHGGYGKELAVSGELWKLRFEDTQIRVARVEQENPPEPRSLHAFASDAGGERFAIFGGGSTASVLGDTWIGARSGAGVAWRELKLDPGPGRRFGFSFAHDEQSGRLVVCGGQTPPGDASQGEAFARDCWALDFTADAPRWTLLARYGPEEFPGRRNPAFTFDQRSGRLFVWGGAAAGESVVPDLFIVRTREDKAPVERVPQSILVPTRASGFGVVDPERSRALLGFGNVRTGPFLDLVEVRLARRPAPPEE